MAVAPIGTHCILEVRGCPFHLLNDLAFIEQSLELASQKGLSTLLQLTSQKFDPQGVTALALLAESHLSIHTWPEHGYAAIDMFTCGDHATPKVACEFLIERFEATDHTLLVLPRGSKIRESLAMIDGPLAGEEELCPVNN